MLLKYKFLNEQRIHLNFNTETHKIILKIIVI